MPIFGSKDKNKNRSVNFSFCSGIPGFARGVAVNATLENAEKRLRIQLRASKNPPVYLAYSQICGVSIVTEQQIEQVQKGVLGRAAVGGVLLGPVGAIVGGMTGLGTEKKVSSRSYVILNYHPASVPDQIKIVSLEIVGATMGLAKFVSEIRENCPLISSQPPSGYL